MDLWQGTGAQSLWQIDTVSGEATGWIGQGESVVRLPTAGSEYHLSPTQDYVAINDVMDHLHVVNVAEASERRVAADGDWFEETFVDWAPDGQAFMYSVVDAEGQASLWLWDEVQGQGTQLLSRVEQAAFAPDGSRIAFLQHEEHRWRAPGEDETEADTESQLPALTLGVLDLASGGDGAVWSGRLPGARNTPRRLARRASSLVAGWRDGGVLARGR